MAENEIFKNGKMSVDVAPRTVGILKTSIQFSTQDQGTAKLSFSLSKDGLPLPLSSAATAKIFLRMADGSVFEKTVSIVDQINGKLEYVLEEEISHPGLAKGELNINYANGQALSVCKFSFNIDASLMDQNIVPVAEYYVKDFNTLQTDIEQRAAFINVTVDEMQEKVDAFESAAVTLDPRLTTVEEKVATATVQLADTTQDLGQRSINVRQPPYNAKQGGNNDLSILQKAVDDANTKGGGEVYLPNGTYMVDALVSLKMKSNVRLRLDDKAVIKAFPTNTTSYKIIDCDQISNFTIVGGTIQGERQDHIGTTGEWGMGINLRGVTDFVIEKITLRDCWGDGLYIGQGAVKLYCENGKIIDVTCDNNRRQGISYISGKNIKIVRPILKNTKGTAPEAGIDFEPNNSNCLIEGVSLESPYTENNNGPGILMALQWYNNTTNEVDLSITNHKDVGSFHGMYLAQLQQSIKGKITVSDPKWFNNKRNSLWVRNWSAFGIQVDILNLFAINPNREGMTSGSFGSGVLIGREPGDTIGDPYIGNINLYNPTVRDSSNPPKMTVGINIQDTTRVDKFVKNVSVVDPIEISGYGVGGNAQMWYGCESGGWLSDRRGILEKDIVNSQPTVRISYPYQLLHNETSITTHSITLDPTLPVSWKVVVEVRSPNKITIKPPIGETIYPIGNSAGKGIYASTIGSRVVLRKINSNSWIVENIVGTWTSEV